MYERHKTVVQVIEAANVPNTVSYLAALRVISGDPQPGMVVELEQTSYRWQIIDTAHYMPDLEKERDTIILLRINGIGDIPTLFLEKGMHLVEVVES